MWLIWNFYNSTMLAVPVLACHVWLYLACIPAGSLCSTVLQCHLCYLRSIVSDDYDYYYCCCYIVVSPDWTNWTTDREALSRTYFDSFCLKPVCPKLPYTVRMLVVGFFVLLYGNNWCISQTASLRSVTAVTCTNLDHLPLLYLQEPTVNVLCVCAWC